MKLNKETRAVLKKELDWLPDLLPETVEEFKVEIFDLDILNLHLRCYGMDNHCIHLLDKSGHKIGEVSRERLYHRYSWPTRKLLTPFLGPVKGDGYSYDNVFVENLEEAIERLKPESWNIQFVLHLDGYYATLYKIPRGRSLSVQLEVKRQEEQARLATFLADN